MPHIILNSLELKSGVCEDVDFKFIAIGEHESLIAISINDKEFFLKLKAKDGGKFILKPDEATRVSPLIYPKKALNLATKFFNIDVINSNINYTKESSSEGLMDLEDFDSKFFNKDCSIEIGFGSGRHLLHKTVENRDKNFIGIEIYKPAIEQILKQRKLQNLNNLHVINYDSRLFLELIPSNTISEIYVHFPVPWDKKPHRRVFSKTFINDAIRILKPNGKLELRTDSKEYFDYVLSLYMELNNNSILIDKNREISISSKYEDRWKKMGKDIFDLVLINREVSEDLVIDNNFSFNQTNKDIKKGLYREVDFFVNIEAIYTISNKDKLLKVCFGDFDRPTKRYILIEDKQPRYFQSNPTPTRANLKAHNLLKEIL